MIWYRKKKMTWGLVALYYMLIAVIFTCLHAKELAALLNGASLEFLHLSVAFVSMCCILYTSAMATRRKWLFAGVGTLLYAAALWVFSQNWGMAPNTICTVVDAGLFVVPMAAALAKQRACVSGLSPLAHYTGRVYPAVMALVALPIGLLLCCFMSASGVLMGTISLWIIMCTSMLILVSVRENRSGQMITSIQELRRFSLVGVFVPCVLMLFCIPPILPLFIPIAIAYIISISITRRKMAIDE